ncbi:diacylglycerol kinase (ATP) [Ereboglobus sp. PH5-10]|uniref:diacylglycerol/lipid kinase family protein n=1 Tax=Ereboglobus sp. PH5-10 TaxID=2940629 RepID=UPI002406E39C|nr:diacylglycerol kinase family protein [Ereboglobus sp. PH5-10]MDF9826811.1 diacylglycerol kinase (ATP) [Ereboglobus sp. PH5-10]
MKKARFIFNPRSGYNISNPHVVERVRRFIAEQNAAGVLDARLVSTERPHHATELARAAIADGCELVVAVGGDGTINETATALVNAPAPVALGLVPCGSGNGLGRHLGIPRPDENALRTLVDGTPRVIDTAMANEHPFFNMMGLGFDAGISARFRSLKKRGFPRYLKIILSEFFRYKPVSCAITPLDENALPAPATAKQRLEAEAFILAIGNSDQYGNDGFITPLARIDDGQLDLTLVRGVSLLNALPLAIRLLTRRLYGSKKVAHLRAPGFVIERSEPGLIHTDGEPREATARIEVKILPQSLRVMTPRGKVP